MRRAMMAGLLVLACTPAYAKGTSAATAAHAQARTAAKANAQISKQAKIEERKEVKMNKVEARLAALEVKQLGKIGAELVGSVCTPSQCFVFTR